MTNPDRDRLLARFYDLEYRDYADDLDFYVQHALAMDPEREMPVLELGCGTGRVALALAKAGFKVVGVDSSEGMLEVCAERAGTIDLQERLSLVRADMRDMRHVPGGPFTTAICALNTFAYLTTTEDQLAMLGSVHRRLVQHGVLLLDLTAPLPGLLPPSEGEVVHQGSYPDPETGGTVHKFVTGRALHATQAHDVRLIYDLEAPDGSPRRITQAVTFRWSGRYEMELLLQVANYRLERLYGSYELDDYDDTSERMIFVAHAK